MRKCLAEGNKARPVEEWGRGAKPARKDMFSGFACASQTRDARKSEGLVKSRPPTPLAKNFRLPDMFDASNRPNSQIFPESLSSLFRGVFSFFSFRSLSSLLSPFSTWKRNRFFILNERSHSRT